jgi:nitric oxide reductase large subunit
MEFKAEQTAIKRKALEKGKRPSCSRESGSANSVSGACVYVFGTMAQSTIGKPIVRYSLKGDLVTMLHACAALCLLVVAAAIILAAAVKVQAVQANCDGAFFCRAHVGDS